MPAHSFQEEIKALLSSYGIPFISEDSATFCILSAQKRQPSGRSAGIVRIILVPVIAQDLESAYRQNMDVRPFVGTPDTLAIAEDRWRKAPDMMTGRLLAHLGIFRAIFARDCEVRKISRSEADCFLEKTHSYGGAKSRYCYGIFLKRERVRDTGIVTGNVKTHNTVFPIGSGTMVAAAEFSNARRWVKDGKEVRSYEWIRYASLPDVRINGGMGKVLKRFVEDVNPDDIMSYADLEWSDGQAYKRLGFIQDGEKGPVSFSIFPLTWERIPISKIAGAVTVTPAPLYFQNFGSLKYRLKLY